MASFYSFLLLSLAAILLEAAAPEEQVRPLLSPEPKPCTSNLPVDAARHIPFNTSELLCSAVWAAEDFVLMFEHSGDYKTWSFVLSTPNNNSYVAIGFSKDGGMEGSSAVVGWLPVDGKGAARQYFLGGMTPKEVKPDKGDLLLVKGKTVMFSKGSRMYLAFQLDATLNQPRNLLIYAIGPPGKIPAADGTLSMHTAMVSTSITFVPDHNSPAPSPMPQGPPQESNSTMFAEGPSSNSSGKATTLHGLGLVTFFIPLVLSLL